ncbi:MAG: hypothetical protein WB987_15170 [Candidatus Acidiferrales bacterium]
MPRIGWMAVLATMLFGVAPLVRAQDPGPLAPPPKFEVKRIPAQPHPGPPPIPEAEIIRRFAANEDVMKKEYDAYNFARAIRIEELTDPGRKFLVSGEVYTKPDGERMLRIEKPPEANLKQTDFTLEDVRIIAQLPLFILTSEEIPNYTFTYAGQDKLDQLNTYVFQVKPKQLSRKRRYFEGAVWVDDRDLTIVKSYGKFVSEIAGNGTKLPFTMFETFRENFQDKYWLPTYTRSDDFIENEKVGELHMRLVIRDTDFKLVGPAAASAAPADGSPGAASAATPPKPPSP